MSTAHWCAILGFFPVIFPLCFVLDSFYCYIFKFTNRLFCVANLLLIPSSMYTFHLRDLIFFFWHFKLNLHFKNMYSISLEIFKHLYLCKHMDYSYNYCFNVFFNYFYHLASFLGVFLVINFYHQYDFYFFSSLHTFFFSCQTLWISTFWGCEMYLYSSKYSWVLSWDMV